MTIKIQTKSQHTASKPITSILLQDASSPRQQAKQCNTSAHVFILNDKPKTKKSKRVAYRHQQFLKVKLVLSVSWASDWGMWVRCLWTVLITPSRFTSELGGPLLYCIVKKLRYLTSGQCYQAGGYKEMSSIVADQYCALHCKKI